MPKKLFISYPSESWNFAQRIAEGITRHLAETVFIDHKSINDADFVVAILTNLRASNAVLLIVTEYTFRDIHKDTDWIRLEIRTALEHNIPIVLVRENALLPPKDLPEDVRLLGRAQGVPFYREFFDPALTMLNEFLVTIGVGTLHTSANISQPQIVSQSPPPPPTIPEPQRAIQGRGSFEEATRLLNNGDYEKALFILRELKDNYPGTLMGAIVQLISDAEAEQVATERRQEATLDYEDIIRLMEGKFTQNQVVVKIAFLEWAKAYPDLVTLLDSKKLKDRFMEPPIPYPPTDPLDTALKTARTFKGKYNHNWTPFTTTFKGLPIRDMKFCLVPVGRFQMGGTEYDDEYPIHLQEIDYPFWIAQTPVTNAQWQIAVKARVVSMPQLPDARRWYNDKKMANAPVVGIDWFTATTYAEWLGCRLLTEREWEYAARGVESCNYPWGNKWLLDNTVIDKNSNSRPNDVTARPQGASWVGAMHLSGNVWEWTSSLDASYPYVFDYVHENISNTESRRVCRGSAWDCDAEHTYSAFRNMVAPRNYDNSLGFRVGI